MTEWEKAQAGCLYDANYDPSLIAMREKCADLCWQLNQCRPSDVETQQKLSRQIIGQVKGNICLTPPFYCDYGCNISVGDNFYTNHNVVILDGAKVTFGDNVFIAPNCVFSTAGHPIDAEQRNAGLEIALPITVGDSVWIGTQVSVLPGVKIGSNVVIGAGSVVNRDIPDGVVAAGNPCRVIRPITEADKRKYPIWKEPKNIELVRLTHEYRPQLENMLTEWLHDIEVNHTNHSPWMIFRNDFHDFDYYLENLEIREETPEGRVPDTTLFCLDRDRNIFVGAVNIRHYLNEGLLATGGHIGDGIRPSERGKGYGTAMVALALEECKRLGIYDVLMCCDKDNIASAKTITNNGGVLENEVDEDGHLEQRYWIHLK